MFTDNPGSHLHFVLFRVFKMLRLICVLSNCCPRLFRPLNLCSLQGPAHPRKPFAHCLNSDLVLEWYLVPIIITANTLWPLRDTNKDRTTGVDRTLENEHYRRSKAVSRPRFIWGLNLKRGCGGYALPPPPPTTPLCTIIILFILSFVCNKSVMRPKLFVGIYCNIKQDFFFL